MTRIRKSIEAIGRRHRLPASVYEEVVNGSGGRRNKRGQGQAVAVGLLIAVGAAALTIVAFGGSLGSSDDSAGPVARSTETSTTPPECPPPPDKPFEATLSTSSGKAGSMVTVSGPMPLFQESGEYDPSTEIQAWWNVDPETYEYLTPGSTVAPSPSGPGDIVLLGTTSPDACTFQLDLQIPDDAMTGTYSLVLLGANPKEASITLYDDLTFDVTG